jgi:hypothetical protein
MSNTKQQTPEIKKVIEEALITLNHSSVCDIYLKVSSLLLVCYNIEKSLMMYFNPVTKLYTEIGIKQLSGVVEKVLKETMTNYRQKRSVDYEWNDELEDEENEKYKDLHTMKQQVTKDKENKKLASLKKSIGDVNFIHGVCILICGHNYDSKFLEKTDYNKSVVNFENGLVCLKTGKFRERTKDDYITKCLDYEYDVKRNEAMIKNIENILLNICNDKKELVEDNKKWFAYCLTGETKEQKFMITVGHSASNGKSTLSKMFKSSFSIYTKKLDKNTFSAGNTKVHKQFVHLKKPIRYIFIEEIDKKKLDCDILKDTTDGDEVNNEVMWGTSEGIQLQCKVGLISNNNINFDTDNGIERRGLLQELTNRFLVKNVYDESIKNKEKGTYLLDNSLMDSFKKSDFKLSFFQILLPYAQKYYSSGLGISEAMRKPFQELCEDNDKMKEFINDNFIITKDSKDKIHKDTFLEMYRYVSNLKNISWQNILNDIKRLGLVYKKNISYKNKQGCLIGIKEKEINDDDDDDSDDDSDNEDDELNTDNAFIKVEVKPIIKSFLLSNLEDLGLNNELCDLSSDLFIKLYVEQNVTKPKKKYTKKVQPVVKYDNDVDDTLNMFN